ncbi:hypothetical protein K5I29_04430 [Flavobacterium agricola]|uniref:Uncharacterized protein n=1 Tax=Flavobacterium agricola TaxID=2870839 RepID=A0ABY6M361_9FLAO|nr:hypothetical protein [Flavobacterium agricola]UYW02154.1 hypothetical protein K5I29_04430 [Flavobacterium agricola]
MKKLILIFALFVACFNTQAQKKSTPAKTTKSSKTLSENKDFGLEANYDQQTLLVYYTNEDKKDTLFIAQTEAAVIPEKFEFKPFKVNDKDLLLITWIEKVENKKDGFIETTYITQHQIWDLVAPRQLASNTHKSYASKDIKAIAKIKDATKTSDSRSSEGFVFELLPNGDYSLATPAKTSIFSYNEKWNRYRYNPNGQNE